MFNEEQWLLTRFWRVLSHSQETLTTRNNFPRKSFVHKCLPSRREVCSGVQFMVILSQDSQMLGTRAGGRGIVDNGEHVGLNRQLIQTFLD